jgi:hypothetical protein
MLKAFVFGGYTVGDTILEQVIKSNLNIPVEYCGSRVDLSKVSPEEHNLIITLNRNTFNMDLHIILGYVKKCLEHPLIVLKRIRTFGGVTFDKNLAINDIFVNKIYIFAGVLYFPKEYFKPTMAELIKGLDKETLRSYFIKDKKRK